MNATNSGQRAASRADNRRMASSVSGSWADEFRRNVSPPGNGAMYGAEDSLITRP